MQIFQFAELKHFQSEQRCQNNCVDLYERSQGAGRQAGRVGSGAGCLLLQLLITLSGQPSPCSQCPPPPLTTSAGAPGVFHQVGIFRTRINFMAPLSQSVAFILALAPLLLLQDDIINLDIRNSSEFAESVR